MQIVKEEVINREWVLRFNVRNSVIVVPTSLIKSSLLFLALCAVFVLAFNTGQLAATEQVQYYEYLHTEGCSPHASAGRIVWECPDLNNTNTIKYPGIK